MLQLIRQNTEQKEYKQIGLNINTEKPTKGRVSGLTAFPKSHYIHTNTHKNKFLLRTVTDTQENPPSPLEGSTFWAQLYAYRIQSEARLQHLGWVDSRYDHYSLRKLSLHRHGARNLARSSEHAASSKPCITTTAVRKVNVITFIAFIKSFYDTHAHTHAHTLMSSVTVFTNPLVTASNGGHSSSFGFPKCLRV
jgi:hypothetical protein